MSMEYNKVPVLIFSLSMIGGFSVVEGDNSIIPRNTPKSKPLIGATRELLLFMISSHGQTNQRLGFWWILGYNGIATTLNLPSLLFFLFGAL